MPIATKCSCGKQFAVPDHLIGKKVACPGCKKGIVVAATRASESSGKSIATKCSCGKSFAAPAHLAGKVVKCPGCKQPVKIAASGSPVRSDAATLAATTGARDSDSGLGGLLDEIGFQRAAAANRCPECKEDLEADAVLCVKCGYNLETGKSLKTKIIGRRDDKSGGSSNGPALGRDVPPSLTKAVGALQWLGILQFLGLMVGAGLIYLTVGSTGTLAAELEPQKGRFIFAVIANLMLLVPTLWAAAKLKTGSHAAWITSLILGGLALPAFPIGTLIGWRLFSALLNPELKSYCK